MISSLLLVGSRSAGASAPETPPGGSPETIPLRINCGGPQYLDASGNVWEADRGFTGGSTTTSAGSIAGADPYGQTLFQSYRYGAHTYAFTVTNATYRVTLGFAQTYAPQFAVGAQVFDVAIEGVTVLQNYDIYADVGANTAAVKSFVTTVADGTLTIEFLDTGADVPTIRFILVEAYTASPPAAISDLAITAGDAQVSFTFTPSPNSTQTNLYWDTTSTVTTADTKVANVQSGYTLTGLTNGVQVWAKVEAENADGVSSLSNLVTATPAAAPTTGIQYYVATTGSDSNDGSSGSPFLTLGKARDAIRVATGRTVTGGAPPLGWQGATVHLADGYYHQTTALLLDSRDSGNASFPIVYQATNPAGAIISGAKAVTAANWNVVDAASDGYALMDASYRTSMYQLDLDTLTGLTASSSSPNGAVWLANYAMLIVGDQMKYMSRYPAGDEATSGAWAAIIGAVAGGKWGASPASTITVSGTTIGNWTEANQEIFFYGPIGESWEVRWQKITGLAVSGANSVLTFNHYGTYSPIVDGTNGKHTFVAMRNMLNVVGKGEVVFRRPTNFMTYRPLDAEAVAWSDDGTRPATYVTHLLNVMQIGSLSGETTSNAANYVTFDGLVFEGARDSAINLYGAIGVTFSDCEIRNNGWCGISGEDLTDFTFDGGSIHDSVVAGYLHGGNKAALTNGNLVVSNCTISEIANNEHANIQQALRFSNRTRTKIACGVLVDTVAFDRCRDVALAVGVNATIRGCTFDEILMIVGDRGAIEGLSVDDPNVGYTNGNVLVEDNVFTNVLQHPRGLDNSWSYVSGIYPESVAYWTIQDNQFTNCTVGINMPAGKVNILRRNKFTNCAQGHHDTAILFGDRINFTSNNTALAYDLALNAVDVEPHLSAFPRLAAFRGAFSVSVSAGTDVFTASKAHGLRNGEIVRRFSGYGSGGAGITASTSTTSVDYYVRDRTSTTFKLAATLGGAAINVTTDGTALRIGLPENRVITYQDDYTVVDNWVDAGRMVKITAGSTWATVWGFQVGIDLTSLNYAAGASLPGGLPAEGGGDTPLSSLD